MIQFAGLSLAILSMVVIAIAAVIGWRRGGAAGQALLLRQLSRFSVIFFAGWVLFLLDSNLRR